MSVYKHNYRAYTGEITPLWNRIAVVARYALAEAWSSRITVVLFTLSLLPSIVFLVMIYVANNPIARALITRGGGSPGLEIDARFFFVVLQVQSWIALAITAWVAPRLISFDLSDNALPILLSHPISRPGYVLAKFVALFGSLSAITWVPCLMLFAYQGYSSPQPWTASNLNIAFGLFFGSVIWIAFLSILGLALSSWVKWRIVATGVIFAAVFVPAGIGGIVSAIMRTKWGFLLNVPYIMSVLWRRLLGAPDFTRFGPSIPTAAIVTTLVIACSACFAMLNARVRAREVVRG
jgi:ABC-type transport system involved in multi-copper enzyme maturation permease subunit